MKNKITQQTIADALNLSRNTVSKALNNKLNIPESTRDMIIHKALELGYKKVDRCQKNNFISENNIILVTHIDYMYNSFWQPFISGLEQVLKNNSFNLIIQVINHKDEQQLIIPQTLFSNKPKGIITTGAFIKEYYTKLKSTGIPSVFVDCPSDITINNLIGDTIMVNNEAIVYHLTKYLIKSKLFQLGFVGNIGTCRSFMERYLGFKNALSDYNIKLNHDYNIIDFKNNHYYNYEDLCVQINKMNKFPQAFVCVNDKTALYIINILKKRGFSIPKDISVTGFDNIEQASIIIPSLTTVECDKEALGKRTAEEVLWRINNKESPLELVRISSEVIKRESTI